MARDASGRFFSTDHLGAARVGIAKDLLRRILTTPCDGGGNLPFTPEEQAWALKVIRERPAWAESTLRGAGL